ncbi:SAM hydroxide adenosyltransferase [Streptomyces malaysiensis]|uniref:SAM hydroxide adenosyltransferase n=1 Tax=Streptomyces malaysiensis TaxID=92644 RepID=UPI002B2CF42E|nr:SAM hydroxide adenosyltransferase [Streptomyces malaysiensis]
MRGTPRRGHEDQRRRPRIELDRIVSLPHTRPTREESVIRGEIVRIDENFGNVWTNIPSELLTGLPQQGERVTIELRDASGTTLELPYCKTFGQVEKASRCCT